MNPIFLDMEISLSTYVTFGQTTRVVILFKGFPKGIAYRGDLLTVKMIIDLYTSEATCPHKYKVRYLSMFESTYTFQVCGYIQILLHSSPHS